VAAGSMVDGGVLAGNVTTDWNDHNVALTTMNAANGINIYAEGEVKGKGVLFGTQNGDIITFGKEGTTIDSEKVTKYINQHGWQLTGSASILGGLVSTDMVNQAASGDTKGATQTAIKGNQTLNVLNNLKHVDTDVGALNLANLGFHGYDLYQSGGNLMQANGMTGNGGMGVIDAHVRLGTVNNSQTWTESYLSQFNATNGNVIIGSDKDVNLLGGTQISAGKDIMLNAGRDLNIAANEDTFKYRDSSTGATVGYNGSWYVGADYSKSKSDSTTYTNASLMAGGNVITNSGRDTNIAGANFLASKQLDMTVGGNLNVETLQNSTQSSSYGGSVTASYGAGGSGTGSAGASVHASQGDRKFADNQTTLIGQEGVRVNVKGETNLVGSMIANVRPDGTDGGNLLLHTGTLNTYNLINDDDSWSVGVSANFAGSDGKTPDGKSNGSKGTLSVARQDVDGITYATIGHGTIIVDGDANVSGLNRDITQASVITNELRSQGEVTVPIPEAVAKPVGEKLNKATLLVLNNIVPNPENNFSFLGQATEFVVGGHELIPDVTNPDIRYSLSEVQANKELAKGSIRTSTNGIDNTPEEAVESATRRKGGTDFQHIYNPKHGIIWDLTEVGWDYAFGEILPTPGIGENIAFHQIIKDVNNARVLDPDGHSQGALVQYLSVQHAPAGLFAGAEVQLSGGPLNAERAQNVIGAITGVEPIIQNNHGDFVGVNLGFNANSFGDAAYAMARVPYLFTDESDHSFYDCHTSYCTGVSPVQYVPPTINTSQ
jgi:hypothetical protein